MREEDTDLMRMQRKMEELSENDDLQMKKFILQFQDLNETLVRRQTADRTIEEIIKLREKWVKLWIVLRFWVSKVVREFS